MENGHMSELSQKKIPRSVMSKNLNFFQFFEKFSAVVQFHGGRKHQFFRFFWKVFENEENPYVFTPGQLQYINSLIWMENRHMSELNQKSSRGLQWAKTSIFFNFLKSFRKGKRTLYSHSRKIKHTNPLIWMENGHMSELSQKRFPRPAVGENFNFLDFLKSFRKWRKSSYSHSRTT